MSNELRIFLLLAVILYFAEIIHLLSNKKLALKYTLLWLVVGVLMLVFVIFPGIIKTFSDAFGFQNHMNALYLLIIGFLVILCISLTSIVSKQTGRIKKLTQNMALIEERLRRLEKSDLDSSRFNNEKEHSTKYNRKSNI